MSSTDLKVNRYTFPPFFTEGDNFCVFLFASLDNPMGSTFNPFALRKAKIVRRETKIKMAELLQLHVHVYPTGLEINSSK